MKEEDYETMGDDVPMNHEHFANATSFIELRMGGGGGRGFFVVLFAA